MEETKLTKKEKRFIRKELLGRLKLLRYMGYAIMVICFLFVEIPMFIKFMKEGQTLKAITSIFGLIYPATVFAGFYMLIEFITGNKIYKFIRGKYTVSRELIYAKHREYSETLDTSLPHSMGVYEETYSNYCDTSGHTRINVIGEESYGNAEIGKIGIVIQFGNNKNDVTIFVPPNE